MKIAVLGTGEVGQTLSGRLAGLEHQVMMGTRDVSVTLSRTVNENRDGRSFSEWHDVNKNVKLATFAEAAAFGEVIFNATNGNNSLSALRLAGASALNGKTLIDVANPLDMSKGMPPVLIASMCNSNSLGEEIQRTFPKVNVVKALNTMWCGLMINPGLAGKGDHNVFICGNETGAKSTLIDILTQFGWKVENILDLGDISASRGMEMVLPLWLRIMFAKGKSSFNFKIVQ